MARLLNGFVPVRPSVLAAAEADTRVRFLIANQLLSYAKPLFCNAPSNFALAIKGEGPHELADVVRTTEQAATSIDVFDIVIQILTQGALDMSIVAQTTTQRKFKQTPGLRLAYEFVDDVVQLDFIKIADAMFLADSIGASTTVQYLFDIFEEEFTNVIFSVEQIRKLFNSTVELLKSYFYEWIVFRNPGSKCDRHERPISQECRRLIVKALSIPGFADWVKPCIEKVRNDHPAAMPDAFYIMLDCLDRALKVKEASGTTGELQEPQNAPHKAAEGTATPGSWTTDVEGSESVGKEIETESATTIRRPAKRGQLDHEGGRYAKKTRIEGRQGHYTVVPGEQSEQKHETNGRSQQHDDNPNDLVSMPLSNDHLQAFEDPQGESKIVALKQTMYGNLLSYTTPLGYSNFFGTPVSTAPSEDRDEAIPAAAISQNINRKVSQVATQAFAVPSTDSSAAHQVPESVARGAALSLWQQAETSLMMTYDGLLNQELPDQSEQRQFGGLDQRDFLDVEILVPTAGEPQFQSRHPAMRLPMMDPFMGSPLPGFAATAFSQTLLEMQQTPVMSANGAFTTTAPTSRILGSESSQETSKEPEPARTGPADAFESRTVNDKGKGRATDIETEDDSETIESGFQPAPRTRPMAAGPAAPGRRPFRAPAAEPGRLVNTSKPSTTKGAAPPKTKPTAVTGLSTTDATATQPAAATTSWTAATDGVLDRSKRPNRGIRAKRFDEIY